MSKTKGMFDYTDRVEANEAVIKEEPRVLVTTRPAKIVGVRWLIVRDKIDGEEIDRIDAFENDKVEILNNDGPWTEIVYDNSQKSGWVKTQFLEFL